MAKQCIECGSGFEAAPDDEEFLLRVSPSFGSRLFAIPLPSRCARCRLRRRLAYRNQIYGYRRPTLNGQTLFSMFPEDMPLRVMAKSEWWSDSFEAADYGREYDFSRPFFDQMLELIQAVPHPALDLFFEENSDYCNNAHTLKNCYLVFNSNHAEDCYYSENVNQSRDCIDCMRTQQSELCFNCVECKNCYNLADSFCCEDCSHGAFLRDCRGCSYCFGCANLQHREYCIFNQQRTKEEYLSFTGSFPGASFSQRREMEARCRVFFDAQPVPNIRGAMSESVNGNYLNRCKNVHDSFYVSDAEDVTRGFNLDLTTKDARDFSYFGKSSELIYECAACGVDTYNLRFCFSCSFQDTNLLYCWFLKQSQDCFGCVGLRRKRFCVLNKEYSQDEYDELVPRIISQMRRNGEWGDFFPLSFAPVAYNHSIA